ncbi:MAG: hypothetical protein IJ762_01345 [Bacteroidaceae bacterium]|nr:hypothetical protein [Bacteroidaceae bacterium]
MKKTYQGLTTTRIPIECQPLMQGSNVKIKAKTKNKEWREEEVKVDEFGLTDISVSNLNP